ncbi:MAG: PEGA domain-containing protein [bacterium]|nr:PEGA domain-containing protein [bacterium]
MKTSALSIRGMAWAMALVMLRVSVAGAVSLPPGSLAVLEPTLQVPEMRVAWDQVQRQLYMDPLLLIKDKEQVAGMLEQWRQSGEAIAASHLTAYRSAMESSGPVLSEAWDAYYGFEYDRALRSLKRMRELVSIPGDTSLRADLAFEMYILEGMVLRAREGKGHGVPFARAAALDMERELPEERYSPGTVEQYLRVRREVSGGAKAFLKVTGSPADMAVIVDGKQTGALNSTLELPPGGHYIELTAPGYEPWYGVVEMDRLTPTNIRQDLAPGGPEDEYAPFFMGRLRAGDKGYLARLVSRLEVDYILIPEGDESTLQAWLLDREGLTVGRGTIWEAGDSVEEGMARMEAMVEPLRQTWSTQAGQVNVNLPEAEPVPESRPEENGIMSGWRRYAVILGAALVIGSMSSASGGGGTRVEVTW